MFSYLHVFAQSISGVIKDESDNPVPFANVFVKETSTGVAADNQGRFFLTIDPGGYTLIISSIGFESKTLNVVVKDRQTKVDIILFSSSVQLNQIEIRARKRDPAYEIIQKTIDNKHKFLTGMQSWRSSIYVKATEVADPKEKKKRQDDTDELTDDPNALFDAAALTRKKEEMRLANIQMVEMRLQLNYQYPDKYKEERIAYKAYGRKDGLFIPIFHETDFNFYYNLVDLKGISEVPLISPLSKTAILSYRYKLEETIKEDDKVVYKIKVTPRKTGDATCKGYIFINDSTWNINRLELSIHKGALKFMDDFTIKQSYEQVADNYWLPYRQEFDYEVKVGQRNFKGNTTLIFSDFEKDYVFPPKFFGNEVGVTTSEAYTRDSSYWSTNRPESLTIDEKKMVAYRDSIHAVVTSKRYLDSVEAKYNKITFADLFIDGMGFRSEARRESWYISPIIGLLEFAVIGGFRFGPHVSYTKRYESEKWIYTGGSLSIGVKNKDLQGSAHFTKRYNPFREGRYHISGGRSFYSINSFDAYLNQLKISNYILDDHVHFFHRIELFNGMYIQNDIRYASRQSVSDYDTRSIINQVIDEVSPLTFAGYHAFITETELAYVPMQKYMREPKQKVVLGSKYPTIIVRHKKGWPSIFSSDVNFDFLEFGLSHRLMLGTIGNSQYTLFAGKFLNQRNLPYIDVKRFRQSDPYLMSTPMYSFQLLDTSLVATDWFIEGHYLHHFNGAMINNIPLVKKLRLRTVAGAGFLWVKESNYRIEEIYGGIERIFKLGARRRLKIGFYGVLSQSNMSAPKADWKVSFDIIDTWKRTWNY